MTLCELRAEMERRLSASRFAHTLGVEREVARMAALYCPEKESMLRAAALLHDLTKEYNADETRRVLDAAGVRLRADEEASPATHHAITAPFEIARLFPDFATPELLFAVRRHTTGGVDMTREQAILYLADVIEEGRSYDACVALRAMFWGADPEGMDEQQRLSHLARVLLFSLEGVRDSIRARGGVVCADTLCAIESLKEKNTLL